MTEILGCLRVTAGEPVVEQTKGGADAAGDGGVPALAVIEVRTVCAVYPTTDALLSRMLDHPSVIHSVLSSADALKVIRLLDESRAWDGIAG